MRLHPFPKQIVVVFFHHPIALIRGLKSSTMVMATPRVIMMERAIATSPTINPVALKVFIVPPLSKELRRKENLDPLPETQLPDVRQCTDIHELWSRSDNLNGLFNLPFSPLPTLAPRFDAMLVQMVGDCRLANVVLVRQLRDQRTRLVIP
jgi:hypothetical protein